MSPQMQGRVALVTGAASGIGRVTARSFAREGARVIVATDLNIRGAEETVNLIREDGGEALFVKCDVSIESDVEAMVARAVDAYGSLDHAFNNAGIGPDGIRIPVVPVVDCPVEIWDRTMDVNLEAVYRHFPILRERRSQAGGQLSGGQQQMLAVGRALMADPELQLMDEPSMGLSPMLVAEVGRIIKDINSRGISVLLVEQNCRLALQLAQRAYILAIGKIGLQGSSQELIDNEEVQRCYMGG